MTALDPAAVEYCPLCKQALVNHARATRHYRGHVRKGRMVTNTDQQFRIPDYTGWFSAGYADGPDSPAALSWWGRFGTLLLTRA